MCAIECGCARSVRACMRPSLLGCVRSCDEPGTYKNDTLQEQRNELEQTDCKRAAKLSSDTILDVQPGERGKAIHQQMNGRIFILDRT